MTSEFKIGDRVCFSSTFLRSIQWHTDVPINGVVVEIRGKKRAAVEWSDDTTSTVVTTNLILESEKGLEPV